tara:strand:- start:383 stop:736 length:354 start_codon:yes stop_codon:yes gene_type:complete
MGKTRETANITAENLVSTNITSDFLNVGTGITMYGGSVGIISATSFYASSSVNADGSITAAGNITANGNIVGDTSTNVSGINSVTATSFHGDGSNLTGLSAGGVTTGKAIAMAMVFG